VMSTPYLFDNAVLDRHARLANGMPVESELEFAEALVLLASYPDVGVQGDDELLDSFMDRKHALTAWSERGGVRLGVLIAVACIGAAFWGWTHGSSRPNGATVFGVLLGAALIVVPTLFIRWWRRGDREAAEYTAEIEGRVEQDTTGVHIWDA
jgi:hypothetical protein